ncbi:hypothetical protein KIW84_071634 [Lathyrus oleraceus]|uniref:Ferric reductase NAD binding domain-containing protein n=1 Tax=Pisum sativum TaxID=3888 RepID=A0A9D4ZWB1_PEA|nr:hypothetical protein KIW84_071634 [Pisum sativum]
MRAAWYGRTINITAALINQSVNYLAERTLRTRRSQHYAIKVLKVSVLPGNVFSLIMSKPNGFKYKSGQQPKLLVDGPYGAPAQDYQNFDVLLLIGLGIGATPFISILRDLLSDTRTIDEQTDSNTETTKSDESFNSFTSSNVTPGRHKRSQRITNAFFYWVTREPGSFEWFKGVMDEVAAMDHKGLIELHNYLTSVYEEGDARSTLITMIQALNHAKHGVDILSGTQVRSSILFNSFISSPVKN